MDPRGIPFAKTVKPIAGRISMPACSVEGAVKQCAVPKRRMQLSLKLNPPSVFLNGDGEVDSTADRIAHSPSEREAGKRARYRHSRRLHMQISKEQVINHLKFKGEDAAANRADSELPAKVDPVKDVELLFGIGIDPQELTGMLPGNFGG
ncbi:hypothetical protein ACX80B_17355 [Arthrobacter monumenti]